jgi:hypothetical protein
MKTAIYIENGNTQLVLTPENDWEKQVIRCIEDGAQSVEIHRASFYECRVGYYRQGTGDDSLILRTKIKTKDEHGCEIPLG